MARDRVQSDELHFTHEFLAMMLGSRRTTVTAVAGALQESGLIEYRRSRLRIVNREGLEAAACNCYPIMKELLTNLYSDPVALSE
jgi:Mn-dependent DtxR family transcriptional regulator